MATKISPSQLTVALLSAYSNPVTRKLAYMLVGKAGIGKSDVVRQVIKHLEISMRDIRLSQMDPTDLRGIPVRTNDGRTAWCPPTMFPDCEKEPFGVLFLDEINAAPPAVSAAAYQLILDRQLGDYKLGDGWMIVAAGNLMSDRGVTYTMPAPLTNRFCWFEVDVDLEDWLMWAARMDIDYSIQAFLKWSPEYLHKFDGAKYTSGEQFPTPRGWERTSASLLLDVPERIRVAMVEGNVGREAAQNFLTFRDNYTRLTTFEAVMDNPVTAPVPNEMGDQYAMTMMLASKMDKFNADKIYEYMKRMRGELQLLCIKLAVERHTAKAKDEGRKDNEIVRTKMYGAFVNQLSETLMRK